MDELDLLKKDWNKDKSEFKNYSDSDIYTMLHKKSSSIVKTLFYISIAELVFWLLASILPYYSSSTFQEKLEASYANPLFLGLSILSYLVILIFIYLLYKSYKAISSTDNAKKLMENILKTRKVIKYYVIYNLIMIFLSIPLSLYFEYNENQEFHQQIAEFSTNQMLVLYGFVVVVAGVFLILLWLFYRLIYGILLKRLNRNYVEIKKLEV
jgi:Ca2+/Na+ antiporter